MTEPIYSGLIEDSIKIKTSRKFTDSGQMIVPCTIARTGVQIYTKKSLNISDSLDTVEVIRKEEEVFDKKSVESFRSLPLTLKHPRDENGKLRKVTSENAKELQVGTLEGIPTRDEDFLVGTVVVADQEAIDAVEGGTRELSVGYICDIVLDDGKYYQTNIRANHLAILDKGRAGPQCIIADGKEKEVKEEVDLKDKLLTKKEGGGTSTEVEDKGLSEAEAAEKLATHEEKETKNKEEEAKWAEDYAVSTKALLEAHRLISKAARDLANNAMTVDSKEDLKVSSKQNLFDDVSTLICAIKEKDAIILKNKEVVDKKSEDLKEDLKERVYLIKLAEEITTLDNLYDFDLLSLRKAIVENVLATDFKDKDAQYIKARLDVICEDSEEKTPLGKMLENSNLVDINDVQADKVASARTRMIKRNKGK